jgi:hypothetical protein
MESLNSVVSFGRDLVTHARSNSGSAVLRNEAIKNVKDVLRKAPYLFLITALYMKSVQYLSKSDEPINIAPLYLGLILYDLYNRPRATPSPSPILPPVQTPAIRYERVPFSVATKNSCSEFRNPGTSFSNRVNRPN